MCKGNLKTVAIVPARGGSKGLPRKNSRLLHGKPLVAYSIEAGLAASLVDGVYVSTEDAEVAELAKKFGATLIERPKELASDTAQNDAVILHALDYLSDLGIYPDTIVLLQPTSPLRTARHIDECIAAFHKAEAVSAMSICRASHHPGKSVVVRGLSIEPFTNDRDMEARRQDMVEVYQQNGAIYLVNTEAFRETRRFYCRPCMPYVMEEKDSIDVDDEIDLQLVELRLLDAREAFCERSKV